MLRGSRPRVWTAVSGNIRPVRFLRNPARDGRPGCHGHRCTRRMRTPGIPASSPQCAAASHKARATPRPRCSGRTKIPSRNRAGRCSQPLTKSVRTATSANPSRPGPRILRHEGAECRGGPWRRLAGRRAVPRSPISGMNSGLKSQPCGVIRVAGTDNFQGFHPLCGRYLPV